MNRYLREFMGHFKKSFFIRIRVVAVLFLMYGGGGIYPRPHMQRRLYPPQSWKRD